LITVAAGINTSDLKYIYHTSPRPEQTNELFIVHASVNGSFGDLEPIHVHDRENRARFSGVDVLISMPGSRSWASFSFAVTNNAGNDKMRIVHDGAKGDTESITEFTTFMDGSRGFGIDMAGISK